MNYISAKIFAFILNLLPHDDNKFKIRKLDNFYYIYKDDITGELLLEYGLLVAALQCYEVFGIFTVPVILLDKDFYKFSESTKRFIIYHESGHFNLHVDKIKLPDLLSDDNYILMENEADVYSMNIVGKPVALQALTDIRNHLFKIDKAGVGMDDRITLMELIDETITN